MLYFQFYSVQYIFLFLLPSPPFFGFMVCGIRPAPPSVEAWSLHHWTPSGESNPTPFENCMLPSVEAVSEET